MKNKFAVQVEAENAEALDTLVSATEKRLKSVGSKIVERGRDDEDCVAYFIVESGKQLTLMIDRFDDLPGKVAIEPL